jgi:hypothetical protein
VIFTLYSTDSFVSRDFGLGANQELTSSIKVLPPGVITLYHTHYAQLIRLRKKLPQLQKLFLRPQHVILQRTQPIEIMTTLV